MWEGGYHEPKPNKERGTTCHFRQELAICPAMFGATSVMRIRRTTDKAAVYTVLCRHQPCAASSRNPAQRSLSEKRQERRGDGMRRGNIRQQVISDVLQLLTSGRRMRPSVY